MQGTGEEIESGLKEWRLATAVNSCGYVGKGRRQARVVKPLMYNVGGSD